MNEIVDAAGTRDFVYDGLSLDTETIQGGGLFSDDVVLERTYDGFGRDGGLSVSGLYDVGYDYDMLGRLDEVTMSPPVGTARTFTYAYVPGADFVDGYTESGTGLTVDRTYAPDRNVLTGVENRMGATTYSRYGYRYDDASRRTHFIVEDVGSGGDYFYAHGYNSKSELISSDRYAGNDPDNPGAAGNPYFDYDYDGIGNRETSAVDGSTRVYTTNDLNQYTAVTTPSQSPIYDVDGNLTEDGAHEFAWDGENRLIQVTDAQAVGGFVTRVQYAYDYLGRMVRRQVDRLEVTQQPPTWQTESVTLYAYDGWRMILELDVLDDDAPLRSHYWGLDLSGTLDGAAGIGGQLATVDHDIPTTYFVLCDGHGNVTQLVHAGDGSEAAEFEYDPYGNRIDTRPDAPLPFGFSTKFLEPETGLYCYGYRWYQPEWGRWVSRDPGEERGGLNLYGLLENSMPNAYDPLGLYDSGSSGPPPTAVPPTTPTPTPPPSPPPSGKCRIEVCCKPVATYTRAHCVIRFTYADGRVSGCRGGPTGTGNSSGAGGSSGSSGKGSGNQQSAHCKGCCGSRGNIIAGCGKGSANVSDPLGYGLKDDLDDAKTNPSHCQLIDESAKACGVEACVAREMLGITSKCYVYHVSGPNSNTTWYNALKNCGYTHNPPRMQPGLGTDFSAADTCQQ